MANMQEVINAELFDSDEELALHVIGVFTAVLSILGSAFVIITFLLFPPLRTHFQQLVCLLSFTDLISACIWITSILFRDWAKDLCSIAGPLQAYFYTSSLVWTACIGNSYTIIKCKFLINSFLCAGSLSY